VLFSNPLPGKDGEINVVYDVKTTNPDGKVEEAKNLKAAKVDMTGKTLSNIFLADDLMGFSDEKSDPSGDWVFEFAVHDLNRKVIVPLKLKLTLQD
jgi:hypothetical protein